MSKPGHPSIQIWPRVKLPRFAITGHRYLVTVDLEHDSVGNEWPYPREEYAVTCMLDTYPLFDLEPLDDSTVILQRYGGSYGEARFLLTASTLPREGRIGLTLIGEAGAPLGTIKLPRTSINDYQYERENSIGTVSVRSIDGVSRSTKTNRRLSSRSPHGKSQVDHPEKLNIETQMVAEATSHGYSFRQVLEGPAGDKLIGRQEVLSALSESLDSPEIAVVALIGVGGIGKSTVAYTWLEELEKRADRPELEVTWRFTGNVEHATASSNDFFIETRSILQKESRRVFDEFEEESPHSDRFISEVAKAQSLVEFFRSGTSIIVLDALEVLQHNEPESKLSNQIYDKAIKQFLIEVAGFRKMEGGGHTNNGRLVIITSRQPLDDLKVLPGFQSIELPALTVEEGATLVGRLGVIGSHGQLRQLAEEFAGHPLSLVLVARLITATHSRIDELTPQLWAATQSEQPSMWDRKVDEVRSALLIFKYYERNLSRPEISLLWMMALFPRAMTLEERGFLFDRAHFLRDARLLSEAELARMERNLIEQGLLFHQASRKEGNWNCHALVREYFRVMFKTQNPQDWRQAHSLLFDYYLSQRTTYRPISRNDLMPSYRAVHHGCLAERYADALRAYRERIVVDDWMAHGTNKLGAISEDAAVLRMFFELDSVEIKAEAWNQLSLNECAWLQARTAFCLTYLGRLDEAVQHRGQELSLCEQQRAELSIDLAELDRDTAHASGKLAELQLLLGDISEADRTASMAVEFADRSDYADERIRTRCRKAAVAHMRGDWNSAAILFGDALSMQAVLTPTMPALSSDHGYLRLSFVLDQIRIDDPLMIEAALHDAEQALDIDARDIRRRWLVAIALDNLSKAAILGHQAIALRSSQRRDDAKIVFDQAYRLLIGSETVIYFPELYLVRARFHLGLNFEAEAIEDAEMALKHARDYRMSLAEADALLILSDIHLTNADRANAKEYYDKAREIVDFTNYGRRRKEIDSLQARLEIRT